MRSICIRIVFFFFVVLFYPTYPFRFLFFPRLTVFPSSVPLSTHTHPVTGTPRIRTFLIGRLDTLVSKSGQSLRHPPMQRSHHAAAAATNGSRTVTEDTQLIRLTGGPRSRPQVTWDDSVVDNENCGKKKSKSALPVFWAFRGSHTRQYAASTTSREPTTSRRLNQTTRTRRRMAADAR